MYSGEENAPLSEAIKQTIGVTESGALKRYSQPDNNRIDKVKAFGINNNLNGKWRFGYYIGVDYIDDANEHPVIVSPKIKNLDYWKMFNKCLSNTATARYVTSIYDVRIEKPFVPRPIQKEMSEITLLIIYHYMVLLSELVKKPLLKSYISIEENLKSKIKGKILLGSHIKKNIFAKRHDRIMCAFSEYSTDCPANRLLHSAYRIGMQYMKNHANIGMSLSSKYNYIESCFQNIDYINSHIELAKIKTNPLFLEYKTALRLAKIIFRIKSYKENAQSKNEIIKIPPFIIDMPKLFEIYTLALLKSANLNVGYQVAGNYGEVDFLEYNNEVVIDAKYKKIYDAETDKYKIEDIRQISGYARDKRLLRELFKTNDDTKDDAWENTVPKCLIIYPSENGIEGFEPKSEKLLDNTTKPIENFNKFFKCAIKLSLST
jgi:5-methylcytosine-specific restriction enzyme subunit McrC